jgi:hypothetical protein
VRAFFDLSYEGDTTFLAPTRMFFKLPVLDLQSSKDMLREEVRFYQAFGNDSRLPLVHRFDALHSEETGASHLLLQDLSDTHS